MWVEKYRPKTLKGVFGHKKIKTALAAYVKDGDMPNLLFVGKNGVGKTAVALVLKHEFGISDRDFLIINASEERGIETIRSKVINFAKMLSTSPTGWKICVLDEADALTQPAQDALRRTMEQYYKTVRFIVTANHLKKGRKGHGVGPAMQSRSSLFQFRGLHPATMKELLFSICLREKLQGIYTPVLQAIAKRAEGDARFAINILEAVSKLEEPTEEDVVELTGIPGEENVFALIYGAMKGKMSALDRLDRMMKAGVDPMQVIMMLYYGAVRGSIPRITSAQRLMILKAVGSVPMSTAEQNLGAIIARMILEVHGGDVPD